MRSGFRLFLCTFLLCVLAGVPAVARASHLRGTSVTWAPTATPGTVQFTVLYSQANYGTAPATVSFPFDYGDGDSTNITGTVTSVNTAESYLTATAVFTHTYTSAGPFIAFYQSCCRVDTFTVGSSATIRMETLVTPFANPVNHPPTAVSPAIITVPMQSPATFQLFAIDQDNDPLQYRLATPAEQYGSGATATCNTQPPPGISVASTGVVTWDLSQITAAGCNYPAPAAGQLWPVQVMIEDLDSNGAVKSKVPVDVLLKLVNVTQPAPTLSFTPSGVINASAGVPITFTAAASNTTPGSRITLNAVGLPAGAAATNLNQTLTQPLSSVFTWTPTQSQLGTYVIVYSATNDTYEQTTGSVSIKVLNVQPPVLTCVSAVQAHYGLATSFPLTVSDPQGDAVTVVWSVDGNPVHTDTVPAESTPGTLSLQQAFNSVGSHTVGVSATNTDNQTSSCSVPVSVTPADQTISFTSLPSLKYGDAPVALTATASSGLPVAFTAAGSCSVVGGALQATGVGTCTVTANQTGNSNYNPASAVVQSTTVARASISGFQLGSSAPTAFVQTSVTFQAAVTGTGATPTGSITFMDGATTLATFPLVNGAAQFADSNLATGTHTIVAIYSGDSNYNGASSAPIAQQVADISPQFAVGTLGSSTQTILPGGTGSYTVTVAPVGTSTFPSDVNLSVSGLPTGATYTLSTNVVAAGSGATQVALTVTAPAATASLNEPGLGNRLAPAALAVLLLPFAGCMRRRSSSLGRLLSLVLLLGGGLVTLGALTGCGSQNGFLTQAQQTYNVTVTASATSVSRSTTAQLIVQ